MGNLNNSIQYLFAVVYAECKKCVRYPVDSQLCLEEGETREWGKLRSKGLQYLIGTFVRYCYKISGVRDT